MTLAQANRRDLDRLLKGIARGPHHLLSPAVTPVEPRVRGPPQGFPVLRESQVGGAAAVKAEPLKTEQNSRRVNTRREGWVNTRREGCAGERERERERDTWR